jgi:hypothetical protein
MRNSCQGFQAKNLCPRNKRAKGQGLVEFGLILPALLLILLGIAEFGRLMITYSSVASASRDAARYGASVGDNAVGIAHYEDCDGIRETIERISMFLDPSVNIEVDVDGPGGIDPVEYCQVGKSVDSINVMLGSQILVTVTATYQPLVFVPILALPPIQITAETNRTILKEIYINQ